MASDSFNVAGITPAVVPTPQPTGSLVQRSVTKGQAAGDAALANSPAPAQPATGTNNSELTSGSAEKVTKAVDKLNQMMEFGRQQLSFQVDDESGRMVIRVTDTKTDQVIRQIPNEETLRFAEYVDGLAGMIFSKNA